MFYRKYLVLNVFLDAPGPLNNVWKAFEPPEAFVVEELRTIFDVIIPTIPGEDGLKKMKNRKF